MKHIVAGATLVFAGFLSGRAAAQNKFLCCDLAAQSGACVAQAGPCSTTSLGYGVQLDEFPASTADGFPIPPGDRSATFPAGVDGYASWNMTVPYMGLCLVAPNARDPKHVSRSEPLGCLQVSLSPGVGAAVAHYAFPVDDALWDAFQVCYGASPCGSVNDAYDPTVAPTPVSGSCCGPAQLLTEQADQSGSQWTVSIGTDIPGVPPPLVIYDAADGGVVTDPGALGDQGFTGVAPAWEPDAAFYFGTYDACLPAYNEPASCGQPTTQEMPPPRLNSAEGSGSGGNSSSGSCSISNVGAAGADWGGELGLSLGGLALAMTRRRARRT